MHTLARVLGASLIAVTAAALLPHTPLAPLAPVAIAAAAPAMDCTEGEYADIYGLFVNAVDDQSGFETAVVGAAVICSDVDYVYHNEFRNWLYFTQYYCFEGWVAFCDWQQINAWWADWAWYSYN